MVHVQSLSPVWLFVTPCTVAHQAPLSMEFSKQEYWRGLPFPSPEDLPNSGIEPESPALQAESLLSEPPGNPLALAYLYNINSNNNNINFPWCVCARPPTLDHLYPTFLILWINPWGWMLALLLFHRWESRVLLPATPCPQQLPGVAVEAAVRVWPGRGVVTDRAAQDWLPRTGFPTPNSRRGIFWKEKRKASPLPRGL